MSDIRLHDVRGHACANSPTGNHKPPRENDHAVYRDGNPLLANCQDCGQPIERAHKHSGSWHTIERATPTQPLRVMRPEEYDTSDDGVLAWSAGRMARRRIEDPKHEDTLMYRGPGLWLASAAMEGTGDPVKRGQLMALADDFERNREQSVIMRVLSGEIDLTSFIKSEDRQ